MVFQQDTSCTCADIFSLSHTRTAGIAFSRYTNSPLDPHSVGSTEFHEHSRLLKVLWSQPPALPIILDTFFFFFFCGQPYTEQSTLLVTSMFNIRAKPVCWPQWCSVWLAHFNSDTVGRLRIQAINSAAAHYYQGKTKKNQEESSFSKLGKNMR